MKIKKLSLLVSILLLAGALFGLGVSAFIPNSHKLNAASEPQGFSFALDSWETIAANPSAYNVGDEKTIELTTGEKITFVILGKNHDDLSDGSGKAPLTIGMKNLLATTYRMNETNTNVGGWNDCEMQNVILPNIFATLSSDLQAIIKQVNKRTFAGNQSTDIVTNADKLFLFSYPEIVATVSAQYVGEGTVYEYWRTVKDGMVATNRIKNLSNGTGSACHWWLRSPVTSAAVSFRTVSSVGGSIAAGGAGDALGVSFGFCIGDAVADIEDTYTVNFLDDSQVVKTINIVENGFLQINDIPHFSGFIPSNYRFSTWQTKDGIVASPDLQITHDFDFYPTMIQNFDYGERINDEVYPNGEYTQADLDRDFGEGTNWGYKLGYKNGLKQGATMQDLDDPFILDRFQILDMSIPYNVTNWVYFSIELDAQQSKYIPITSEYNGGKTYLTLLALGKSESGTGIGGANPPKGGKVYLIQTSQKIQQSTITALPANATILWAEDFQKFNSRDKQSTKVLATFSFELFLSGSNLKWQISYGYTGKVVATHSDVLRTAYKYDLNKIEYCIGITGLWLNRSNSWTEASNCYSTYVSTGVKVATNNQANKTEYPKLSVSGRYAIQQKAIECYIEGEYAFTFYSNANAYQRPIIPEDFVREDETLEWYIDQQFTQKLMPQYVARDYDKLYGKWIPAQFEVVLQYWTLDRFYDSAQTKFFEVIVQKQVARWYAKGSVINLNDFAQDQFVIKFYDAIPYFSFINWDTDITQPVTSDMIVKGKYKIPSATLYYYDVNNSLYGTVKQQFFLFPLNELSSELNRLGSAWNGEKENGGLLGFFGDFFEFLCELLVGPGNGKKNEAARDAERQNAAYIIRQLAAHWSNDNQLFMCIIRPDINLQHLNKGAYGNSAFVVEPEKNPQWHLISGFPESNDLVYYIDLHGYYSLGTTGNLNLVINFTKSMTASDKLMQTINDVFGWLGSFFGGIFKNLWWVLLIIGIIILCIFCWPLVIAVIKAIFSIITWPIRWLGKKANSGTSKPRKKHR